MINLIIGVAGTFLILIAFVLDEFFKKYNQETVFYNVVNMFGSAMLTYYAVTLMSWPFIILNIVWFLVALYKLEKIMRK